MRKKTNTTVSNKNNAESTTSAPSIVNDASFALETGSSNSASDGTSASVSENLLADGTNASDAVFKGTSGSFLLSDEYLQEGLSSSEVQERKDKGLVNGDMEIRTKTYGQIFVSNVFSLFTIINFALAILIFASSEKFSDAIFQAGFLVLVFVNILTGLIQETRAKRTIDRLSLLNAPKAKVMRDGKAVEIPLSEVVLNDLLVLEAGNQICADAVVVSGTAEANESLITGEPDAIPKAKDSRLLSGSFVVSGKVKASVEHIGKDNYAQKISSGAKYIKKPNADIFCSLKAIIRLMSFVIIPLGVGIFLKTLLYDKASVNESILALAASMLGMIPQGLMALTSMVFAVSVVKLSKRNTLSQDLYSVETLARVDMLCLDKTGTITEGTIQVDELLPYKKTAEKEMEDALSALAKALSDNNPTFNAVKDKFGDEASVLVPAVSIAFSSARKWSGATFALNADGSIAAPAADKNSAEPVAREANPDMSNAAAKISGVVSYMMGAAEFLLPKNVLAPAQEIIKMYSEKGQRVLVLAKSDRPLEEGKKPLNVKLMGFILMSDKIRAEAPITLRYFAKQGVEIKVISGDNPVTVSAIAKKAGLRGADNYIDASTLETDAQVAEAALKYKIFGRVTPDQKLLLVKALKANGHTVAMTGDGVNDVLALREADCSIAMASGSDAARTVSQLVLLDSNFASMPMILAEGRRNINNLQRTAGLYLTKTVYSLLMAILFILPWMGTYPYEPIHFTFMGGFAIGIPSFLLAFSPNKERVKGRFLTSTLSRSLPGAISLFVCIVIVQIINLELALPQIQVSTISMMLLAMISFMVLYRVSLPLNRWRLALIVVLVLLFFTAWRLLTDVNIPVLASIVATVNISLVPLGDFTNTMLSILLPLLLLGTVLMILLTLFFDKYATKHEFKIIEKALRVDREKL